MPHNAQALCRACNLKKSAMNDQIIRPNADVYAFQYMKQPPDYRKLRGYRAWQVDALNQFSEKLRKGERDFALMAWPGAGKTLWAGGAFLTARKMGLVSKCLWLVPSSYLKASVSRRDKPGDRIQDCSEIVWEGLKSSPRWEVKREAKNDALWATESHVNGFWPGGDDYPIWLLTYQQVVQDGARFAMLVGQLKRRSDEDVLLIMDEAHHIQRKQKWGIAIAQLSEACRLRVAMSGTMFNSVGAEIPHVPFEDVDDSETGEKVRRFKPHYSFGMKDSLRIQPGEETPSIRMVRFRKAKGDGEFIYEDPKTRRTFTRTVIIDDELKGGDDNIIGMLQPRNSKMAQTMLREGRNELNKYRKADNQAAGMVVCVDTAHANSVASYMQELLGYRPVVVHSGDDEDGPMDAESEKLIAEFRRSSQAWIISVKMVSEGVDIPRLRVLVYLTNCQTRLYFTQVIGRIWRWEHRLCQEQDAVAIIPARPELVKIATEMEADMQAVIEEEKLRPPKLPPEDPPKDKPVLISSSTDGKMDGGVAAGMGYEEEANSVAHQVHEAIFKETDGTVNIPITNILLMKHHFEKVNGTRVETEFSERLVVGLDDDNRVRKMTATLGALYEKCPPDDLGDENPHAYVNRKLNAATNLSAWRGGVATKEQKNQRIALIQKMLRLQRERMERKATA